MSSHCHLPDHCHTSHHCHPSHHCHSSHHCHLHNWRHISRQMRMLDLRLQLLRDRLCAARLHRLSLPCCCSHHHHHHHFRCPGRRALCRAKRLGMLLSSSCCHLPCHGPCHSHFHSHCHLPCDVKCFDPHDVCVSVKDGKVTVHAEHKDECDTGLSKSCSYRRFTKEFSLPPGEEEVTYSEECNSLTKIEPAKCCSHICDL